jgi:hypothetical protein
MRTHGHLPVVGGQREETYRSRSMRHPSTNATMSILCTLLRSGHGCCRYFHTRAVDQFLSSGRNRRNRLTGLVFVAMSLNLKAIARDATHRYRAINTLTGLALVFMRCALVLMGGENHRAIGAELFVVCGISAAIFAKGYANAITMSDGLRLSRIVGGSLVHMAEITGAALFFFDHLAGLLHRSGSDRHKHVLHGHRGLVTRYRRFRSDLGPIARRSEPGHLRS